MNDLYLVVWNDDTKEFNNWNGEEYSSLEEALKVLTETRQQYKKDTFKIAYTEFIKHNDSDLTAMCLIDL
jgi:glucokinase